MAANWPRPAAHTARPASLRAPRSSHSPRPRRSPPLSAHRHRSHHPGTERHRRKNPLVPNPPRTPAPLRTHPATLPRHKKGPAIRPPILDGSDLIPPNLLHRRSPNHAPHFRLARPPRHYAVASLTAPTHPFQKRRPRPPTRIPTRHPARAARARQPRRRGYSPARSRADAETRVPPASTDCAQSASKTHSRESPARNRQPGPPLLPAARPPASGFPPGRTYKERPIGVFAR